MRRVIYDRALHRATEIARGVKSAKRAKQAPYWDRFFQRLVNGELMLADVSIWTVKVFSAYWNKLPPEVREQYTHIAYAIKLRRPEILAQDAKEREKNKLKRYGAKIDTSFLYGKWE